MGPCIGLELKATGYPMNHMILYNMYMLSCFILKTKHGNFIFFIFENR